MIRNIDELIQGLLSVFNPKQNRVIIGRFGLKNGRRATLQEIGDELGVTRERVRQIEEDSLKKLEPKIKDGAADLLDFAQTHLSNSGGVRRDDVLVEDVANYFYPHSEIKNLSSKIRFVFFAAGHPLHSRENDDSHGFWYSDDGAKKKFLEFVKDVSNTLKSDGKRVQLSSKYDIPGADDFASCDFLKIPKIFGANVFGDFGLRASPEIEPKTIRDKIYLVLKKRSEPLHFSDIAKSVTKMGIDKKAAHVQTVHNELIKDDRFVLVGRGIYGLKENGFEPGTVREVIARLLKKHGPMHPADVITLINSQRFLKENTILLSLQNRRDFRRFSDGRYHVKEA